MLEFWHFPLFRGPATSAAWHVAYPLTPGVVKSLLDAVQEQVAAGECSLKGQAVASQKQGAELQEMLQAEQAPVHNSPDSATAGGCRT